MLAIHQHFELVHQQIVYCWLLGKQGLLKDFKSVLLLTAVTALEPAFKHLAKGTFTDEFTTVILVIKAFDFPLDELFRPEALLIHA